MRLLLICLITFFALQANAQVYSAYKASMIYFVEIKKDSAKVEIYDDSHTRFVHKSFDDFIAMNATNPHKLIELEVRKGNYILKVRKDTNKRFKKIHLKSAASVDGKTLRNQYYLSHTSTLMLKLLDSLSGPNSRIYVDIYDRYRKVNINLTDNEYQTLVDKITDSLKVEINHLKNPSIDVYYQKSNSISKLDTLEIYNLLSKSNYKFTYSNYLLHKIAIARPEVLVAYIDTKPSNEKLVLRAIRDHRNFKEITKNVKETALSSKGKRKIVKQKSKRIISDISLGTAYLSIILVEIAALTALGIWIF